MNIAIIGKLHSYHNETVEEAFAKGELAVVSDDLPQLLGSTPLNFEDVVRALYAK